MTENLKSPEHSGQTADAVKENWVDRFAPIKTRPYLRLSRADRPIGTWLLLIPCYWGLLLAMLASGARLFDLWIAIGCALGAFLMRGAGCTWNDFTDREFDASVARTRSRPIPSGQVSPKKALLWMAVQAGVAFFILISFPPFAILLGVISILPVLVYPFAKRFTWWPQVFLGIAFNWGALLAWAAHENALGWAPILAYIGGLFWTLFYDTIYAYQDVEDDALIGVKSTARLFGENPRSWMFVFLAGTLVCLTLAISAIAGSMNPLALMLTLGGVWGMGWHLTWQMRKLDISDPQNCLILFRSNRDAGLIFCLGLVAALIANMI